MILKSSGIRSALYSRNSPGNSLRAARSPLAPKMTSTRLEGLLLGVALSVMSDSGILLSNFVRSDSIHQSGDLILGPPAVDDMGGERELREGKYSSSGSPAGRGSPAAGRAQKRRRPARRLCDEQASCVIDHPLREGSGSLPSRCYTTASGSCSGGRRRVRKKPITAPRAPACHVSRATR